MSVSVSELGSADGGDVADITLEDGRELQASVRDVMPDDGVMVLESPVVDDVMEFRSVSTPTSCGAVTRRRTAS
jgi:hypothetical protein